MKWIKAFIKFTRPHTIVGTILSISMLYLIAFSFSDQSDLHVTAYLFTIISCLCANIYIVGLNQITDIEIDKINKPWLPLAAGEYSKSTAWIIILVSAVISFGIAVYFGGYLLLTVLMSLFLGTIYSLPPIRLKQYYFWAAFCIIAIRGLTVNIFLFLHFQMLMSGLRNLPALILLLTATIFIYSVAIAWFKDVPDMEGDKHFRIKTLTLRMGARKVFYFGNSLLGGSILLLILSPFVLSMPVNLRLFIPMHIFLILVLVAGMISVQLENKSSFRRFYLLIWFLFFLEYITFGLSSYYYS